MTGDKSPVTIFVRPPQPRLNDLLQGRIATFSMAMPVKPGTRAGFRVEMKLRKAA